MSKISTTENQLKLVFILYQTVGQVRPDFRYEDKLNQSGDKFFSSHASNTFIKYCGKKYERNCKYLFCLSKIQERFLASGQISQYRLS